MKYTEIRTITAYALQKLCIKNNWYTKGNNREYAHMLTRADVCDYYSTERIAETAADIIEHSDGLTEEDMTSVMYEIAKVSVIFFYTKVE